MAICRKAPCDAMDTVIGVLGGGELGRCCAKQPRPRAYVSRCLTRCPIALREKSHFTTTLVTSRTCRWCANLRKDAELLLSRSNLWTWRCWKCSPRRIQTSNPSCSQFASSRVMTTSLRIGRKQLITNCKMLSSKSGNMLASEGDLDQACNQGVRIPEASRILELVG